MQSIIPVLKPAFFNILAMYNNPNGFAHRSYAAKSYIHGFTSKIFLNVVVALGLVFQDEDPIIDQNINFLNAQEQ